MLKNYFNIAIRNIKRHKGYTFLNVAGLAIGIASCLLISFFIKNETGYDSYHESAERIYRVAIDIQSRAGNRFFAQTSAPLAPALKKDFPQVEKAIRIWRQNGKLVTYGSKKSFYEDNFFFADPEIFDVFDLPLTKGDVKSVLSKPFTVVITSDAASKYFGREEPIGKILTINNKDYEVSGVIQKIPYNSHLTFNLITSLASVENEGWYKEYEIGENWFSTMFYTYIKLKEKTNIEELERRIATAANPYVGKELKEAGSNYHYILQPLKDIHLHSHFRDEAQIPGNAINVYIFTAVAILILLIASLNYINLTTAQSANRAKEVGVRKVIGATKKPLVFQFMGESLLLTLLALVLAIIIVAITRPLFETLSGYSFNSNLIFSPVFYLVVIGLTILLGIMAAIYPALFLSSFRPVKVLSGKLSLGVKGGKLRQILVTGQFTISIILIVGTIIVFKQLNFMKEQNLGFNKEQVLILPVRGGTNIADRYEQIKNEFTKNPSIVGATISQSTPGEEVPNYKIWLEGETDDKSQDMYYLFTDFDFLETYQIGMVAGRPFDKTIKTDATSAFIINEKAVKAFGWSSPEVAIGKTLATGFGRKGTIVGVYKDFHYRALQAPIEPLVMAINEGQFHNISLRLKTEDVSTTLSFVRNKWQELFPNTPYEYSFLDQQFDQQYKSDENTGRTFLVFTCIAICIACLGLFGLSTFVAQQRTKEIGVRKVLGASVAAIAALLSKDFVKLVVVAFLIAVPASYILINNWLESFATRIAIDWQIFAIAGIAILAITLITISFQSIKSALADPVKSLRNN
jgi:putative ABC transport system permease protein